MIETQGGGIRKFLISKNKDFFLCQSIIFENKVKVTITGKVINEEFAKILINNPEITLEDIILLDKVQKQVQLSEMNSNT
jgi:ATP-dependent DNA helicase RecG